MSDIYTNENDKIPCRLRIKGTFFTRNGVKQVCMMLSETINITIGEELKFKCAQCPDPVKRDELLEKTREMPTCIYCGKNMATKTVPRDVVVIPGEPTITTGSLLCISCFEGVNYKYQEEEMQKWQLEYEQLERDYEDGKITYSMLIDAKEKLSRRAG